MEKPTEKDTHPSSGELRGSDKDVSLKGVTGIQNVGNTCYCNAALQILRASPEWSSYCLERDFNERCKNNIESKHTKVLVAYQDILKSLWAAYKPSYIRPLGFISTIDAVVKDTIYDMFGKRIANDSHEYLTFLLDNFHEALKLPDQGLPKVDVPSTISHKERMQILAANGWNSFLSKNKSEVTDLFFGMMRKTIHCIGCNNCTYSWEVFNCFKIPCEGETFMEWMQNECAESEIEEYSCEHCKPRKTTAKIYSHIWQLPHTMFTAIRRFNFDGRKNNKKCPYNGENLSLTSLFAIESDHPSKHWSYELRGVVDHHGSHHGGHYASQFKHPISGEWWLIDDETANKLETPVFSQSNYIFLFRKSNAGA